MTLIKKYWVYNNISRPIVIIIELNILCLKGSVSAIKKTLYPIRKHKRKQCDQTLGIFPIPGNFGHKLGRLLVQTGWERLWEFGHWAWEFLRFGSSHTERKNKRKRFRYRGDISFRIKKIEVNYDQF